MRSQVGREEKEGRGDAKFQSGEPVVVAPNIVS